MQKELNVIIVEDDPYARDFMSMLLRRDWRTRVVGEFISLSEKEIVVKTIKSLDDLTGSGDTDISRIAQSIYARLDKATAATEIRAAGLDEQINQVLGRDLINQQLADRKKKLAEKTLNPCMQENASSDLLEVFFVPTYRRGQLRESPGATDFNDPIWQEHCNTCLNGFRSK